MFPPPYIPPSSRLSSREAFARGSAAGPVQDARLSPMGLSAGTDDPLVVAPTPPLPLNPLGTESTDHELNKQLCSPVLDMFGLCHCSRDVQAHVPVLVPMQGRVFPPCRDPSFRAMYIDDSILASSIRLDKDCVPLIHTMAPYGRSDSCGFGIPGQWFSLEHRLRDIQRNVKSIGMIINT